MIISGVVKDGNLTPVTCTHLLPPIDPVFSYLPNPCWVFASWAQHGHHCQRIMIIYSFWCSLLLVLELSLPLSLKRSAQYFVPTLVTSHTLQDTWSEELSRFISLVMPPLEDSASLLCVWGLSRPLDRCWWKHSLHYDEFVTALLRFYFPCPVWLTWFCFYLLSCSGKKHSHLELSAPKGGFWKLAHMMLLSSYYSFSIVVYWMLDWECFQNWALARTAPEHSIFQYILEKCWLLPVRIFYFFLSGILSLLLIFRNFILICSVCGLLLFYCPEHMVGVSTWKTMGFSSGNVSYIMGFCSRCPTYLLGFLSGASVSQRLALLS